MQAEELDRLITEVGPLDENILACVKTSEGAYAVRFENVDVLVERDENRDRIALSIEIGTPRPSRAAEINETLLSYNMLWRETGGVLMALAGRGGPVVQFVELAGSEVNARTVATVAVNMASLCETWRAFLNAADDAAAPPVSQPRAAADMIRA